MIVPVELKSVEQSFGEAQVIKGVDLAGALGECVVFIGLSGCGQPKLLRMIAGLEEVSREGILVEGQDATAGERQIDGIVDILEYLDADTSVIVDCDAAGWITARVQGHVEPAPGTPILLAFEAEDLRALGADGMAKG